jgi:hypothetical protein
MSDITVFGNESYFNNKVSFFDGATVYGELLNASGNPISGSGAQGIQGISGVQGLTGIQGTQGIQGAGGLTTTNASTVTLTAGSDTTSFVIFSGTATGNIALNTDTGLTYNPSTNILGATISGSAASWTTGRTISLTGDVTGTSAAFNGTANLSFATTLANGVVAAANLDGAQTGTAPIYGTRAWVNFNGTGTIAIRADGNVSSITDGGVGIYTINFTTAMPNANYCVTMCSRSNSNTAYIAFLDDATVPTTAAVKINTATPTVGNADSDYVFVSVIG